MPIDDPLITAAAAAKALGLNESTVRRQIAAGKVRSHDGLVRLSEVLQDRLDNVDLSRARRRNGEPDAIDATEPIPDAAEADDLSLAGIEIVTLDGQSLPYAAAKSMRETYLARMAQLEFETRRRELISLPDAVKIVEGRYAVVRERLLSMIGKISDGLAGRQRTRHEVETIIRDEVFEALEELSNPRELMKEVGSGRH